MAHWPALPSARHSSAGQPVQLFDLLLGCLCYLLVLGTLGRVVEQDRQCRGPRSRPAKSNVASLSCSPNRSSSAGNGVTVTGDCCADFASTAAQPSAAHYFGCEPFVELVPLQRFHAGPHRSQLVVQFVARQRSRPIALLPARARPDSTHRRDKR